MFQVRGDTFIFSYVKLELNSLKALAYLQVGVCTCPSIWKMPFNLEKKSRASPTCSGMKSNSENKEKHQ